MATPVRAAIYTRQSLDKTGDGLAVARQLAEDEALCAARGWTVVARESDNDLSGYSGKPRPGYQRLLTAMQERRVDVVVTWAVDRLTRRLADLVDLMDLCQETGVKIATVSGDLDLSTDSGRLVARILGSVAQGEVERKATRQKLAAQQAAAAGKARMGCPRPFGWLSDRVTAHPDEGAAVEAGCRALLAGGTVAGVARDWTARGVRPAQSQTGKWTRTSVVTILRNPRIAGIATYKKTEVGRGEWQPLVDEQVWRAVVKLLADPSRRHARGVRTMLGGVARCRCGNTVTASENALHQPIYRCTPQTRDGRPGPHVTIRSGLIDEYVSAVVVERLSRDDAVDLLAAPGSQEEIDRLRDEAQVLRARLATLGGDYVDGLITRDDLLSGRTRGEARLAVITDRLATLGGGSALAPLVSADDVQATWDDLGADRKRAVVDALMTVTLLPPGRGRRDIDPAAVVRVGWAAAT